MDLEVIKTVLAVAKSKSFSIAAYSIPCSQSSVSRRVETAEAELGVKIFQRPTSGGSRNVELTEKGLEIIRAMNKIVDAYSDMYYIASEIETAQKNFHLGIRKNMLAPMAVSLMKADLYETNRNIAVSTTSLPLNDLFVELYEKKLDAILFSCVDVDRDVLFIPKGYHMKHLGRMRLHIGLSSRNRLAEKDSLLPADLSNETFFLGEFKDDNVPGVIISSSQRLFHYFEQYKKPSLKVFPDDMLDIRYKLVMENKGMIASYTPDPWRLVENITYLPLKDCDLFTSYYLIYAEGDKEDGILSFADFFSSQLSY